MFKVFNRGQKLPLNDTDYPSSKLPPSNYRRQASLRHSHYFGHTEDYSSTLSSIKSAGVPKLNSHICNSKKYVSCENIRKPCEEFQDVIDEDSGDDEDGLKDKLVKRYNSLTTLLMKSFRKAKIKKKKEAMQSEIPKLETNYEELKPSNGKNTPEKPLLINNSNNCDNGTIKSNDLTVFNKAKIQNSKLSLTKEPINSSKIPTSKNFLHDTENDEDENENDDEEIEDSVPVFLGVKMISNDFVDIKPPVKHEQTPKSNHSTLSRQINHKIDPQQIKPNSINSAETKKSDFVKPNFNSHSKPQAPRAPVQQQLMSKPLGNSIDDSSISKKQPMATVKRSKTFTQQMQDLLIERKRNSVLQNLDNRLDQELSQNEDQSEKIETIRIESLSNNVSKNSKKSSESSLDLDLERSSFVDEFSNDSTNFMKHHNRQSFLSNKIFDLSSSYNSSPVDSEDSINQEEFNDLVHVLARQDNDFKKKFFDCLMTKLWDTTLPYGEYLQLNRLMTALFGESYHKLDLNYLQHRRQSQHPNNKMDAEQVVKLMKIYLESNSENQPQSNFIYPKEDFDLEYLSVGNLINTLKRRKKYDTLASQVNAFSSRYEKFVSHEPSKQETKTKTENKFSFLNDFDAENKDTKILSLNSVQALKLNQKEDKFLLDKYFELNISKDNLSPSQIIDKRSVQAESDTSQFEHNSLRKTLGNASNVQRRPPPPPLANNTQLTNNKSPIMPTLIQNMKTDKQQVFYKTNNSNVKSSGIIASFQPAASQFIAQNTSSNNQCSLNSKRNSTIVLNTLEVKKDLGISKSNANPTGPIPSKLNIATNPPKPKVATMNQHEKEALQRKLTQIRSVRELFKNEDTNNNLIYARPECLKKADVFVGVSKNENVNNIQTDNKKRSISTNGTTNKYLVNALIDNKTKVQNNKQIISNSYTASPVVLNKTIYTTYSQSQRKMLSQEPVLPAKSKLILKQPPPQQQLHSFNRDMGQFVAKKVNGFNHLSDLISNKFYKYDGREMKQAYY